MQATSPRVSLLNLYIHGLREILTIWGDLPSYIKQAQSSTLWHPLRNYPSVQRN
jgi:hypothetical protein